MKETICDIIWIILVFGFSILAQVATDRILKGIFFGLFGLILIGGPALLNYYFKNDQSDC